jgi:Zn-dependent protease
MKHLHPPGPSLRFSVRGVQIHVNWSLPFLGAGIAYLPATHSAGSALANYLAAFLCLLLLVVLHEVGHALAAWACSMRVHAIVLSGYGGCCVADIPDRPLQAALFAAGGLLVQLLVAVLAIWYLLGHGSPSSHAVNSALFVLIGANALYMLMNLAPFQGSDGARLLAIARQVLAERISK